MKRRLPMLNKKTLVWFGLSLLVVGLYLVFTQGQEPSWKPFGSGKMRTNMNRETSQSLFVDRERRIITLGEHQLEVEVVSTAESTAQGLSGRESIGADGMLFVFPDKSVRRFWMPDMQFDLDMVWINDMTVVGVTAHVPKPDPQQVSLPTYSSDVPVNRVLELPAGRAQELFIVPGTTIIY